MEATKNYTISITKSLKGGLGPKRRDLRDAYKSVYMEPSSHLKDDNPGIGNVVKVDSSLVRVAVPSMTPGVIPVPVDTEPCYTDAPIGQRLGA